MKPDPKGFPSQQNRRRHGSDWGVVNENGEVGFLGGGEAPQRLHHEGKCPGVDRRSG